MSNVKFFRDAQLEALRADISSNLSKYQNDTSWVEADFNDSPWFLESDIKMAEFSLKIPTTDNLYDIENTEIVYSTFKNLPLAHAADERLWVYLTHVYCWEYMTKRWNPQSKSKKAPFIKERYFFIPNKSRAIVRNGLARLWWYGYLTYDEKKEDPFELTKIMLSKLDIAQSLLERSISHAPNITKGVLDVLNEKAKANKPFDNRENFRNLMKYLNQIAGVKVLDMLELEEIKSIVTNKIDRILVNA